MTSANGLKSPKRKVARQNLHVVYSRDLQIDNVLNNGSFNHNLSRVENSNIHEEQKISYDQ